MIKAEGNIELRNVQIQGTTIPVELATILV